MAIKELTVFQKAEEYKKQLVEDYRRWNGYAEPFRITYDPFYEDGYNMNLSRRRILFTKEKIKNELPESLYPAEYFLENPAKMPDDYIAGQETLVERGGKRLGEILQMPDYLALLRTGYADRFSRKEDDKNHIFYYAVVGYVENFKRSLQDAKTYTPGNRCRFPYHQTPYLDLRRYAGYKDDWWTDAFQRCLAGIKSTYPEMVTWWTQEEKPNAELPENKVPVPARIICLEQKEKKQKNTRKDTYQIEGQFSFFDLGIL